MKQGAQWLVLGVIGSAMLLTFCGGKSDDDGSGGGAGRAGSGTGGTGGVAARAGFVGKGGTDTANCHPGVCGGPCGPCSVGGAGNGGAGFGGGGAGNGGACDGPNPPFYGCPCRSDTCACSPGMCHPAGDIVQCFPCGGAGNGGAGFGGAGGGGAGNGGAGVGGGCNTDTCPCLPGTCRVAGSVLCEPCGGAGFAGGGAGGGCGGDTCGPVGGGGFGPEGGAANDGGASASLDWIPPSRKMVAPAPMVRACYAANASEGDPCLPPDGAIVGWLSDLPPGCDAQVKGGPFSAMDERGLLCCYSIECLGERSGPVE